MGKNNNPYSTSAMAEIKERLDNPNLRFADISSDLSDLAAELKETKSEIAKLRKEVAKLKKEIRGF